MINIGPNLPIVTPKNVASTHPIKSEAITKAKPVTQPEDRPLTDRRKKNDRRSSRKGLKQKPLLELRAGRNRRQTPEGNAPSIDTSV